MFFSKCRLRLIQTNAGSMPDADSNAEKWLVVELIREPLEKYINTKLFWEWQGEGYGVWGKYSVKANHTGNNFDSSFYIGQGEPKLSPKIWRFKASDLTLYFGTVTTNVGGGGLGFGETTDEVRNDLVLNNVNPLGREIKPSNGRDYGNGFVDVPSWLQPFRKGTIFWKPNDIVLSH